MHQTPPSPKSYILTVPHCLFGAGSPSYLRGCLPGCSPRFAPNETTCNSHVVHLLVDVCVTGVLVRRGQDADTQRIRTSEDAARRQPSTSERQGPQKEPALQTPLSWTAGLQNCKRHNSAVSAATAGHFVFCVLSLISFE